MIHARFKDRPFHQHNRLIKNVAFNAQEREALATAIVDRLAEATGPTEYFLPLHGIEEWDKPGEPAHDPEGLTAFITASLAAPARAFGYTVMKHAQIGLVRAIARDFGRDGVRCNAVCPGWVTTEMADAEMDELMERTGLATREAAYAHVTKDVPLGRPASPGEVAAAIAFLCAPEASATTGAVLTVDGGSTIVDVPTLAFG